MIQNSVNRLLCAGLLFCGISGFAGAWSSYAIRQDVKALKAEMGGTIKTLAERMRASEAALDAERVMVANLMAKQASQAKPEPKAVAQEPAGPTVRPAGFDGDKASIR